MTTGAGEGRAGRRRTAAIAVLAAAAAVVPASGALAAPPRADRLTRAEQAFARRYRLLIPALDRASAALLSAVGDSSHYTNAQIVTVFTAVAREWESATRPLLKLAVPPQVSSTLMTVKREVPAVEGDLLAAANSGRTQSKAAATAAGRKLAIDYHVLGVAIGQLKRKLSLP